MPWTKHFSAIKSVPRLPVEDRSASAYSTLTGRTSSWLNIAYQGNPQRIPRYYQFQEMDADSDINTALDTIADFCTQSEEQSDEPFEVKFNGEPNESEVKIIKQMLERWIKINSLRSRLWYMFRDTIKNGDAFFLRDPETFEWLWLDHFMVELVKVDETKGKVPDEYIVRGLDYNRQSKFATTQADPNAYRTPYGTSTVGGARPMAASGASSGAGPFNMAGTGLDQRQRGMQGPYAQELSVIDADHVVHLSLSIGNDINWPFGASILEPIFKTYKQKELLEDAIIIYRVQRAPERRIFYIDVGTMPPERAKRHIEAIKNDIHQRRIPNRSATGGSVLDAAYNPLSIQDDYFFASCLNLNTSILLLDGRSLTLREIIDEHEQGKDNWVYSQNTTTHELEAGRIKWAGVTRKNATMVRVTLDSGEFVDATPDHRFILRDGHEIDAGDLKPGQSLMPLYLRKGTADSIRNHKVVSVELLPYTEDTGDITIETESGSHIFALAAGIYVHNSSDGRGSKVETLPGGDGNNEILDLTFFSKKLARGLRVPTSYLNIGEDQATGVQFNDGKLGAAMIQEYRFSKYCMRLQSLLAPSFDHEFKHFLRKNGIEIEPGLFELTFNPPQSFTRYRQIELDSQRIQVYQGVAENKKISERIKFKRYLGWSDDEIIENEEFWSEENADKLKRKTGASPAESGMGDGLSAVGIHPEGDMGMDMGMDEMPVEEPPAGADAATPGMPAGGAAPPPGPAGGAGAATPPPA